MPPGRRPPGRRMAIPTVLAASAAFHLLLLALLLRSLASGPSHAEGPVLQVSLVRPPERLRPASTERRARRTAPATIRDHLAPIPPEPSAVAPRMAEAPSADAGAAMRRALGGLAGCDRPGLSREDRDRCEARRWTGGGTAAARLNLDPAGRNAKDPEPFLSKRPRKGCRVRVTGDIDPMGESGNGVGGVTCVIPF